MHRVIFLVCLLVSSHIAMALQKVGEAPLYYLFWHVYDASLHTETGEFEGIKGPLKLTLVYQRDFKAKDIAKETLNQWQKLGMEDAIKQHQATLEGLWPDIKEGDSLSLLLNADGSAAIYYNEDVYQQVNDERFASDFLAIWLSEKTTEPKMRARLIGAK